MDLRVLLARNNQKIVGTIICFIFVNVVDDFILCWRTTMLQIRDQGCSLDDRIALSICLPRQRNDKLDDLLVS